MTPDWVHPGLLLILGACLLPFLKGRFKRIAMLGLPAAALIACLLTKPGTYGVATFLGQDLVFGRVDRLSLVFSYVFSLMALLGMPGRRMPTRGRAHRLRLSWPPAQKPLDWRLWAGSAWSPTARKLTSYPCF